MAVVSARQRTRGIVMISVLIFLMWVGYAMIMTPVSKLLLQRECHHLNISSTRCHDASNSTLDPEQHRLYNEAQKRSTDKLSLLLLLQGMVSLVANPVLGVTSSTIGRKPVLVWNGLAFTLANTAWALFSDWHTVMAIQCVCGLGGGTYTLIGVSFAALADLTEKAPPSTRASVFGLVESVLWCGLLVGPFLGGKLFDLIGYQDTFIATAVPPALGTLAIAVGFSETVAEKQRFDWRRANPVGMLAILGSQKTATMVSAVAFFVLCSYEGPIVLLPLYGSKVLGMSTAEAGMVLTIFFASSAFGLAVLLPLATAKLGISAKGVMVFAMGWAALIWFLAGLCSAKWELIVVFACSAAMGMFLPIYRAVIADIFGARLYGVSVGATATLQQVCHTLAPFVFTQIYSHTVGMGGSIPHVIDELGPRIGFSFAPAACCLIALAISVGVPRAAMNPRTHGGNAGDGADRAGARGSIQGAELEKAPLLGGKMQ